MHTKTTAIFSHSLQKPANVEHNPVITDELMETDGGEKEVFELMTRESSVPASASSQEDNSRPVSPIAASYPTSVPQALSLDAEASRLMSMIPKCMFDPPILPADCQWVCPVAGCSALFDLKGKLPRSVLMHLSPQEIGLLKSRAFTSKSLEALSIFYMVVDVHYDEHLSKLGIAADKEVGNCVIQCSQLKNYKQKMFRQIQPT